MLDVIKILVIIVGIIRVEVTIFTNVIKDKLSQKNENTKRKFRGVRRLPNKITERQKGNEWASEDIQTTSNELK